MFNKYLQQRQYMQQVYISLFHNLPSLYTTVEIAVPARGFASDTQSPVGFNPAASVQACTALLTNAGSYSLLHTYV